MFNLFSKSDQKKIDISSKEFQEMLKDERGVIVDVRTLQEYNAGHLADTDLQLDFLNGDFHDAVKDFDPAKTYYLYCRSGNRSGQAARLMQREGFENVYNVGGFEDLARAGFDTNP